MTVLKVMLLMLLAATPIFTGAGDQVGLFEGRKRECLWSLNGGCGTKENFALDGDYAIPILDPACESPFGHQETGVGFGDWYLTLCGSLSGSNFLVLHKQMEFSLPSKALAQWTQYEPGKFPIEGDRE